VPEVGHGHQRVRTTDREDRLIADANLAAKQARPAAHTGVTLTEPMPTVSTLQAITDAFNRHDLDAIMSFFADDAVFLSPRGPEPVGRATASSPGRTPSGRSSSSG
jgi:hypothetical protein